MANTKTKVDALWRDLRLAINKAYAGAKELPAGQQRDDLECLRDYAEDISMTDDLEGLLNRETVNEKQHRYNRPSVPGFSAETASKLILMENVRKGMEMAEMPRATAFLVLRQTAVEAEVIGFLIKGSLHEQWSQVVASLDYAALMQGAA